MEDRVKPKRTRNAKKTREKLLRAGIRLFSSLGYAGVSVDEIVGRAGCNKRMLYHYFGNKDGLYVTVLENVFSRLERIEIGSLRDGEDLEKSVQGLIARYFDFLESDQEFVHLLMWENLHEGRFLSRHPQLLSKSPVIEELQRILKRNRIQVCPRHFLIQLFSTCFIYHSNRYTLSHTTRLDLKDSEVRWEGVLQATKLILEGLKARK